MQVLKRNRKLYKNGVGQSLSHIKFLGDKFSMKKRFIFFMVIVVVAILQNVVFAGTII